MPKATSVRSSARPHSAVRKKRVFLNNIANIDLERYDFDNPVYNRILFDFQPSNYIIPTGRLTATGLPEESRLDGFRGRTILDAKFTDNFRSSPYIPSSSIYPPIFQSALTKEREQFEKFKILVDDPSIPFDEVEVLVNDARTAPYFQDLLDEFNLPVRVRVVPTQILF